MGDEDELGNGGPLPAQVPDPRATPIEVELCAEILTQARVDLRGAGSRRRERLRRDALDWIADDDELWVFSFVNVCRALQLDAGAVRARLLAVKPDRIARVKVKGRRRRLATCAA